MSSRILVCGAAIMGVWLLFAAGQYDEAPSSKLTLPTLALDCTYFCRECGTDRHDIVVAVTNNARSIHLENCNPGSCGSHECGQPGDDFAELTEFLNSVKLANGESIRELIRGSPQHVWYNRHRGALQVQGCGSEVLASIPLRPDQVEVLLAD